MEAKQQEVAEKIYFDKIYKSSVEQSLHRLEEEVKSLKKDFIDRKKKQLVGQHNKDIYIMQIFKIKIQVAAGSIMFQEEFVNVVDLLLCFLGINAVLIQDWYTARFKILGLHLDKSYVFELKQYGNLKNLVCSREEYICINAWCGKQELAWQYKMSFFENFWSSKIKIQVATGSPLWIRTTVQFFFLGVEFVSEVDLLLVFFFLC